MAQRELVKKPYPILEIEGVNERIARVEQQIGEWDEHDGCFPEYAGMQTRNYGKRLLYKFTNPVFNIFQFWTPYGYAAALIQFQGSVSAAPWLVPAGGIINLPPLTLPTDSNGNTVTTIGWSSNSPVPNNNTNQSIQGPVNDTNGLGGGQVCNYTGQNPQVVVGFPSVNTGYQWGTNNSNTNFNVGTPPGPPVPYIPSLPVVWPTSYSGTPGSFGKIPLANYSQGSAVYNLGFGNWNLQQSMSTQNTKAIINLAALNPYPEPPSITEFQVQHNGNPPFVSAWYQVGGIDWSATGNATAFPLDVSKYIIPNYSQVPTAGAAGGFIYSDWILLTGVRFTYGPLRCQKL